MDFKEFALKLDLAKKILDSEASKNDIANIGVETLYISYLYRIFNKGENSKGFKIGEYSKKPMYARRDDFVRKTSFEAQGKTNKSKFFKNGKKRETMYLDKGYWQLRGTQGLNNSYVDLRYNGSLYLSIKKRQSTKGTAYIIIENDNEINKKNGLEKKYGIIFTPTIKETELSINAMFNRYTKKLNELLR